jgi:hypothetical protein
VRYEETFNKKTHKHQKCPILLSPPEKCFGLCNGYSKDQLKKEEPRLLNRM